MLNEKKKRCVVFTLFEWGNRKVYVGVEKSNENM